MKSVKRIGVVLAAILGYFFSMSSCYLIMYHRILISSIGFRTIHVVALYALIMIIGVTVYICLKRKRKTVSIILIIISLLYALGMMALAIHYKGRLITSSTIEDEYDIVRNKNTDISYCRLEKDAVKVVLKKNKKCNKEVDTRFVITRDDDYKSIRTFTETKRLDTGKKNYGYLRFDFPLECAEYVYSEKTLHYEDIYLILDNNVFPISSRIKDTFLSRVFTRGDMDEYYDMKCSTIFLCWLLVLCGLLVLITRETQIVRRFDDYCSKIPLSELLDEHCNYKTARASDHTLIIIEGRYYYERLKSIQREIDNISDDIDNEHYISAQQYIDKLEDEETYIFFNDEEQKWVIDDETLKYMGARKARNYKVTLTETSDDFFNGLIEYDYCIDEIYPKSK